ncbi:ABC transporter ATP-binding protein [Microbacterium galbinum]|uniref:ABC transporter ATP-binding protein n=1 Tax=Microbacterium galbinum TaxID=2851646 RepID=UPI002001B60C|nr:ABC transporter ATP-binding protein [Microbacterium galbinum]
MTASPDARPEKAEDPTTESKATPEKRTATSKRASASSPTAKKASAARTNAAKKTPAARTPAKRPSTAKAAAEKAAAGTDVVIEPVSAAGPIEKKVPARPAAGARATTTRTPAKSAAAKTAAAKSAAAKKTTAASTTAAAKTTAAKTTAAKTAAARSAAAKSTAAKTTAAKSTTAKTAAAKTAATKAQAAKSTARTAASRAASTRTTAAKTAAAKTAAAKAAAAQAAEVAEPKPQAPVTIESTRIDPPEAVVEVEETAGAGATVGVDEVLVEAETAEADVVEPEVVKAEVVEPVIEPEVVEPEVVEAEIVEPETTEAGPEVEATDVRSEASAVAAESAAPAASDVEALHIRGLVKHFGDNRAVHGIDLSVPAGSFYGIVGPNGAGKTTTLSIIAGLLRADAGSVVICGIDQATNSQAAKRVMGVLPDRLRTFDRLTGRQLLYYYGLLRGLASDVIEKRVADLARAFDLGDALGRVVSDYSAGMTKKVMLAGAMIHSPRVLVLDEPFESVDPVSSAVILDILRAYVAHGGTVILSSHGMDLVERVCSRVAIIVDGEVLAEGTIDEVRAGQTLEARFVELSGGIGEVEGLEWLHTFSD